MFQTGLPQNNDSLLTRTPIIPKAQFVVFTPSVIDYSQTFFLKLTTVCRSREAFALYNLFNILIFSLL